MRFLCFSPFSPLVASQREPKAALHYSPPLYFILTITSEVGQAESMAVAQDYTSTAE